MSFPFFRYNYRWQYNGAASFHEICTWCRQTFGPEGPSAGNWQAAWETIHFVREEDYAVFLLRWV